MDPIRFDKDLRVTIQALGWQQGGRYLPLRTTSPRWPSGTSAAARQFPPLPSGADLTIKPLVIEPLKAAGKN